MDSNGRHCLDIYNALRNDHTTKNMLSELVNGVRHQLRSSSISDDEKKKYDWFINYHNTKLSDENCHFLNCKSKSI